MASNNDGKAIPLSHNKGKSAHVKCCNQRWNEIKPDALRIYKEEDKDLQFTMDAIQEIYGFKASIRRWKDKFKEWGCKKNISVHDTQWIVAKGTKRAGQGKDTAFFHNDTRVTTQRIENFKRRKTRGEPDSISTPPNITYSTPAAGRESPPAGLDSEEHSMKMSNFFITRDSSVKPLSSKTNDPLSTIFDLEELSSVSMIERYLLDYVEPWSILHPFHHNDNSDLATSKYLQRAAQVLTFGERDFIDPLLGIESDENGMCLLGSDSLSRFKRQLQENDPVVEESIEMLNFDLDQYSPHLECNWSAYRHSLVREYLLSNHRTYNTSFISDPCVNQFESLSGSGNLAQGSGNFSSSKSLIESESHKYGLTYSVSEITGISDSIFMKP